MYGTRDFKRDFAAAAYQIFLVIIEASENARTDGTENNTVLDEGKFYQSLKKERILTKSGTDRQFRIHSSFLDDFEFTILREKA